jgi:hypothetical protein
MALFEDSGWYKVDYAYTNKLNWGKDEGCDFISDECITNGVANFDEFCTDSGSTEMCDFSHLHKGYCNLEKSLSGIPSDYQYFTSSSWGGSDIYIDYCPVVKQRSGGNCRGHDLVDTELESSKYEEEACEECRCITGTYVKKGDPFEHAGCHKVLECKSDSVIIEIDGEEVECDFDGGDVEVDGYDGVVHCPNTNILC